MDLEHLSECLVCGDLDLEDADAQHRLSRCRQCGFVFDNPRPGQASIIEFYSRPSKYDHWVGGDTARREMWLRRLKKLDKLNVSGAVLDVGAGIGEFLHYAGDRFDRRVGTEVSREAVEIARVQFGIELLHCQFESAIFQQPFDLVTLFHVLEHVPCPRRTVERCFEAIRPGGYLVLAVPNDLASAKLKVKGMLAASGIRRFAAVGPLGLPAITLDDAQGEVHLSHFDPGVLRRLIEWAGFVDVRASLDPYYAETGVRRMQHNARYLVGEAVHRVSGRNVYDTIWLEARRPG